MYCTQRKPTKRNLAYEKPKLKKLDSTKKRAYALLDGPMKGETLYLSSPGTCVFSLGTFHGHYVEKAIPDVDEDLNPTKPKHSSLVWEDIIV